MFQIRALTSHDHFEKLRDLVNSTIRRLNPKISYAYGNNYDFEAHFYRNCEGDGFVVEEDDEIVAFMGVILAKGSTAGKLHFGFLEGQESKLDLLLKQCEENVKAKDGHKLVIRSFVQFGQIRNKMITLCERFGFISDEYIWTSTNLDLRKWHAPENLDTSSIEPAPQSSISDIHRILVEDQELAMANLISHQYSHRNEAQKTQTPDRVILSLKNHANDIVGIAYYQVVYFNKGHYEGYNAVAFCMHFRTNYDIARSEKRRFIQTVLSSMKELGIHRAASRITFKDFDLFSLMAVEGFDCITSQVHSVDLTKTLESH